MTAREAVAKAVIAFEGGDANDPDDRGGLTHYGLTLDTYREYKPDATAPDLLRLTRDQVIDVITEVRVLRPGLYRVTDPRVLYAAVDISVNSGARPAVKALQRAAGVPKKSVDGIFGPGTEAAVNGYADQAQLFRRLMAQRVRLYGDILRARPSQVKFAHSWLDRAATILEEA